MQSAIGAHRSTRFLTHADRRLGRGGIHEIHDHPAFVEVNWTTLATGELVCVPSEHIIKYWISETAPPLLHLPQFSYAEPSIVLPPAEDDSHSHSQPFAFSALFQSSQITSPGAPELHANATPRRGSLGSSFTPPPRDDAFIGFSWGPLDDAFPALPVGDRSFSPVAGHQGDFPGMATPRPARLSAPTLATPNPNLRLFTHPTTATPAGFHSYPFLTPVRPGTGTAHTRSHPTLPRSTIRRAAGTGRRPVSDREAMKQLADCVGMSARKKVLASGRKPRVLPALAPVLPPQAASSRSSSRRAPPAVSVPDFASSSQGRLRPARAVTAPEAEGTETETEESEGPPSPSPTPRPGSAMSMFSRRSGTPTITGTHSLHSHSLRSGVLGGASGSGMLGGASASGASLSVPLARTNSARRAERVAVARSPTWEDTTFDELERKHAAMLEEIGMLEDRLDRFSALVGCSRSA